MIHKNEFIFKYACYYDEKIKTFLGDVYSVKWLEDSDKENLRKETLEQQFHRVKKETNTSQGTDGEFKLLNSQNGVSVALKASTATAADVSFTLPALDGTAGQALVTNGAGVLSFGDVDPEDPVVTLPSAAFKALWKKTKVRHKLITAEMVGRGSWMS